MMTRLLTCGFVNGLDRAAMLSRSPETLDARGQASKHWPRLLLFWVIVFISFMLSIDMSHARPAKDPMNYKLHAYNQLKDWDQFECIVELYERESNWRPEARNGSHHGIPQGKSQWLAKADPYKQVEWGVRYIKARYGSPCVALTHFKRKGWH
jgi:hypothetical protein